MSKNTDNLKEIMQYTMDLNRLRWSYEEMLLESTYYKKITNKAIEFIQNKVRELKEDGFYIRLEKQDIYNLLDILKGSDSNDR